MKNIALRCATAISAFGLAVSLAGTDAAASVMMPAKQIIVCEFAVWRGGTYKYANQQFVPDVASRIGYLYSGTIVWADQHAFPHRASGDMVRELTGSGGGWVWAKHLVRTGRKCLPL
ncbi:hypothetical protein [Crossiella cryophila]|uniref:Uncharacterized protein n=1 Tax=Crossiella cryophila TaxID=43355 RepID=A0A7W7FYN4_9PSEU|nr:hypothetical protein [Crossiella cryophila]MBB4681848.1 hypothetical protein [Crossiella cryophila]